MDTSKGQSERLQAAWAALLCGLSKMWAWWWGPSLSAGDAVERIERDLESLRDEAEATLARCRAMNPKAFDDRRDRRAGDREGDAA